MRHSLPILSCKRLFENRCFNFLKQKLYLPYQNCFVVLHFLFIANFVNVGLYCGDSNAFVRLLAGVSEFCLLVHLIVPPKSGGYTTKK